MTRYLWHVTCPIGKNESSESSCQDHSNICNLEGSVELMNSNVLHNSMRYVTLMCVFVAISKMKANQKICTHKLPVDQMKCSHLKRCQITRGKRIKCWCVLEGTVITMLVYSPFSTFRRMFSHSRVQCPHKLTEMPVYTQSFDGIATTSHRGLQQC